MSKAKYSEYCDKGSKIATVLFDKTKYSIAEAKKWLEDNDFKYGTVTTPAEYHRFTQEEPADFKEDSFRTTNFDGKMPKGVKVVIGCPKHEKKENGGNIDYDFIIAWYAGTRNWLIKANTASAKDFILSEKGRNWLGQTDSLVENTFRMLAVYDKAIKQGYSCQIIDATDNKELNRAQVELDYNNGKYQIREGGAPYAQYQKGGIVDKYKIELLDWAAQVYEDDYNQGEGANINNFNGKVNATFNNADDLFDYICTQVLHTELERTAFNAFEDGRITTSITVDNENYPASTAEIELWKRGEKELFSAHFDFYVALVDRKIPTTEEMSKLLGIPQYADGGEIMASGGNVGRNTVLFDEGGLRIAEKNGIVNYNFNEHGHDALRFDTEDAGEAAAIIMGIKLKDNKKLRSLPVTEKQREGIIPYDVIYWLSGGHGVWKFGVDNYAVKYDRVWEECFKNKFDKKFRHAIKDVRSIGGLIDIYTKEFPMSKFVSAELEVGCLSGEEDDDRFEKGGSIPKKGTKEYYHLKIARKIAKNPTLSGTQYGMTIPEAEKLLGKKIITQYPSFGGEFKELVDRGDTQTYARDCGFAEGGGKKIPLVAIGTIRDRRGFIPEKDLAGAPFDVTIELFANPAYIDKEHWDNVRESTGLEESTDEDLYIDLVNGFMAGVAVDDKQFKTKMDAITFLLGKEVKHNLDILFESNEMLLNHPTNRNGTTGWDVIKGMVDAKMKLYGSGGNVDDDVRFLSPAVVINMDNYKPYADNNELRKKAKKYLESLVGQKFSLEESNPEIKFKITNEAAKHTTGTAGLTKLIITKQLPEIFKHAGIYSIEEEKNLNPKNPYILKCRTHIMVSNALYEFRFVLKLAADGEHYFYDGTININAPE